MKKGNDIIKLISPAISFIEYKNDKQIETIIKGCDHSTILDYVHFAELKVDKDACIYGFITDTKKFVDRKEAMVIAKKNNQLKSVYKNTTEIFLKSFMIEW